MVFTLAQPAKAVTTTITALIIATVLFLQSASSVLSVKDPATAVRLWSGNGIALEQLAYRQFSDSVKDPKQLSGPANNAAKFARQAFDNSSLSPRAHAILALAQADADKKTAIIRTAPALNRRNLMIQSLALDHYLAEENYSASLTTLDSLMRVHPQLAGTFFPILDQAFVVPSSLPEFDRILDGSSDWHERYINNALYNDALLLNLAEFRNLYRKPDPQFDRELIKKLARIGEYDTAFAIHASIPGIAEGKQSGNFILPWSDTYPPIDWLLVEETDIRAQRTINGTDLEIYVKSGSGGIVAERIIDPSTDVIVIKIEHDLPVGERKESANIQVKCAEATTPFFVQPLRSHSETARVDLTTSRCTTYLLRLNVRAWTGRPTIRGTIKPITIESPLQ